MSHLATEILISRAPLTKPLPFVEKETIKFGKPHTEASILCIFGCPKFPRIMVSFICEGLLMILYATRSTAIEWPTCTAFWLQCKQWNGQLARPFGCSASNGMANLHGLLGAVQVMEWLNLPAFGCGSAMKWPFGTLLFWMRCNNVVVPTDLIYYSFSVNILYTCIQYSLCSNTCIFHCSNAQHAAQKIVSSPCTECFLFRKKTSHYGLSYYYWVTKCSGVHIP